MTAEHILDAMNELPDHILQQTDAIRHRKRISWQPFATAACLVLAVGAIWGLLLGPAKESLDFAGTAMEDGAVMQDKVDAESTVGGWWLATVLTVEQDRLTVRLDSGEEAEVALERLQERPEFAAGQRIWIYLEEAELPTQRPLKPYRIEIKED